MLPLVRWLAYPARSVLPALTGAFCFLITTPVMIAVRLRSTPEAKAANVRKPAEA